MRRNRLRHQRKHDVVYDRHHIIPQSVCRRLGIDPNFEGNVKTIRQDRHRAWHLLFGNMTSEEAIGHIRKNWSLPDDIKREFDRLKEE